MNKRGAVAALMMTILVLSPFAEAKRVGSGKSYGMSRSNSSASNNGNSSQSRQASSPSSTPAQPQRSGPGVGTMVAAGAAGVAAGYMLGHSSDARAEQNANSTVSSNAVASNESAGIAQQQASADKSGFSWLWIIVLAIAAFFVFRRFTGRKTVGHGTAFSTGHSGGHQAVHTANNSLKGSNRNYPAGTPSQQDNTNIFGQSVGNAASGSVFTNNGNQLPDGTEPAAFLRQARAKFLHLQSMNSASNIEEVRRYFTPEMYAVIREDILSNDELAEFPQLTARVIDSGNDNGQYVASVQFDGTVSETLNAQPVPFSEIWHFVKSPINQTGNQEWLVAGIQQN